MFLSGFDNSKSPKVYLGEYHPFPPLGGKGDSYGHTNVRTFTNLVLKTFKISTFHKGIWTYTKSCWKFDKCRIISAVIVGQG